MPVGDKSKVAAAAVTVEPNTGHVLAMAENKIFNPTAGPGSTEINYNVDTALGGSAGFQTGSTFKAFTLATWLKDGRGLNATIDASRKSIPVNEFIRCGHSHIASSEIYNFNNSEPSEGGRLSVLGATAGSVNTAFVNMEQQLPLCDIAKTAQDMGVHLAGKAKLRYGQPATTDVPDCIASMTLGPFSIAPLTMASGYATFAADGTYCPPFPVLSITDADGAGVPIKTPTCDKEALDPDVAHGVTYALKGVLRVGGTASNVAGAVPGHVAGKTGTTNNSVDTWFVGYTKERTTAVWVGDPNTYKKGDGTYGRRSLNGRTIGAQSLRDGVRRDDRGAHLGGDHADRGQGHRHQRLGRPPGLHARRQRQHGLAGDRRPGRHRQVDRRGLRDPDAGRLLAAGRAARWTVTCRPVSSPRPSRAAARARRAGDTVVVHLSNGRGGGTGQGITRGAWQAAPATEDRSRRGRCQPALSRRAGGGPPRRRGRPPRGPSSAAAPSS